MWSPVEQTIVVPEMDTNKTLHATMIAVVLLAGTALLPTASAATQLQTVEHPIYCYSEDPGAITELLLAVCDFADDSIHCIGNYDPYNDPPASFVDCEV